MGLSPASADGFVPAWPFAVPPQPAHPEPARLPTGKSMARLALEARETPPLSVNASAEPLERTAPAFELNAPLPERVEKGGGNSPPPLPLPPPRPPWIVQLPVPHVYSPPPP